MEFKQLEAFVKVVDLGSFSKAAKVLYLTQPTVSTHIGSLEKELGTRLILRTTKEVALSEPGKILYGYAKDILSLRHDAEAALGSYNTQVRGTLYIAASSVPRQYFLPELMAAFLGQYPEVSFSVLQGDSAQVAELLEGQSVDIGLVGTALDDLLFDSMPFFEDTLVIATPNSPDYRTYTEVSAETLSKLPFIVREEGSGTRKETEQVLAELGISTARLNVVAQLDDMESIKQSISKGLGISILSQRAVEDFVRFEKVLAFGLKERELRRKLYVVSRKNRPLSHLARTFAAFAVNYYR